VLRVAAAICVQCLVTIGAAEAQTVGSYVDSSECSTMVGRPLSEQIAEEVQCLLPGQMVPFAEGDGLVFTGTVLPWIDAEARDDLLAVAADGDLEITSAYRTVAQQYLLWAWWQAGRCGITAAADPGDSNHESGRAVDLGNWEVRVNAMAAHGWAHDVPGDPVHFDHPSSADIRGSDVQAFQRLWNRNHPDELIDEDGTWGAMTEMALALAPAGGFELGPTCDPIDYPPGGGKGPGDGDGEDPGEATGGCSAGGGGGWGIVLVGLLFTVRARSRSGASPRRHR
jgi:hypothetical protein